MKITPVKDYKKPVFAIGIAAAMALSVTACKEPGVQLAGDVATVETTEEVQLDGEVAIEPSDETCDPATDCTSSDTSSTTNDLVHLDGGVSVDDDC